MTYEEELELLQQDAMSELEDNNDTDTDNNQREESDGDSPEYEEDGDDRENFEGDEEEDDFEDGDELDEEEDDDDNDDDEQDEDDDTSEKDTSDFEPIEVEVNGQKILLESNDEVKAYLKNSQSDTPKRNRKSDNDRIVEQGQLSKEDLALYIDAKNGDKAAMAKIAKNSGVDVYDLDNDLADTYKPTFSQREVSELDEVAEDIMSNETLYSSFKETISTVPQDFVTAVSSDVNALKNFAKHIESGLAQEVIPLATKAKLLEGGSFMEHYAKIGRELSEQKRTEKKPTDSKTKRVKNPRADKLRKKATNKKGSNKGTKTTMNGDDVWAMSSKDFDKKFMGGN